MGELGAIVVFVTVLPLHDVPTLLSAIKTGTSVIERRQCLSFSNKRLTFFLDRHTRKPIILLLWLLKP